MTFIDLYAPEREKFETIEFGADCSFFDLSDQAQKIAIELENEAMQSDNPASVLTRLLDSDMRFRTLIGKEDMDVLPMEVDVVQRHMRARIKGVL